MGLVDTPYAWDHLRVESRSLPGPVTSWFWRSVGDSQSAFAVESFVDELAAHVGTDGLSLRRRLLSGQARHLAVLAELERKADPLQALPPGRGRGIAIHRNARTIVAQAIDVEVSPAGTLSVQRVVAIVDCAHVVNPLAATRQIEGAIVFGLTAALHGEVEVQAGQVVQGNFDTYRMLTMRDTPPIEVHFLPSGGDNWGGIGEPGVPPVAPALCNAIQRAIGHRIRSLPVARHDLRWSATRPTP
jgi:isoquinoline 1-oxidoreductase beta subunit